MALDFSEIKFIKRFVVGNDNPQSLKTNAEIEKQLEKLNNALNTPPKGRILSIERNFALLALNEHQLKLEWTVYQVGFTRKLVGSEHD